MTTPIDVKALRELLAKATPGPWQSIDNVIFSVEPGGPHPLEGNCADGALIVAAINALPALLDAAEDRERLSAGLGAALRWSYDTSVREHVADRDDKWATPKANYTEQYVADVRLIRRALDAALSKEPK